MHGLVSLLDPEHYQQVENLWNELEEECGLEGIKVTPYPHFSWLIAEDFDWESFESEELRNTPKHKELSIMRLNTLKGSLSLQ